MKGILVSITTSAQTFPFGTTPQNYRFEISGPESRFIDVQYGTGLSAQFDNVEPGDYTVTVELLDPGGQRLGNILTSTVNVPADVILQVPAGLTVQVISV